MKFGFYLSPNCTIHLIERESLKVSSLIGHYRGKEYCDSVPDYFLKLMIKKWVYLGK